MSIRKRIPLLIAFFVLISISLTSIFTYYQASTIVYEGSKTEMISVNKRAIETISVMIEKEQLEVGSFSTEREIQEVFAAKTADPNSNITKELFDKNATKLQEYVRNADHIEQILLVDKSGTVFSGSDPKSVGVSYVEKNFNSTSLGGNKSVSETIDNKETGLKTLIFTSPVIGSDRYNTVLGYVALSIKAESFSKYLKDIKVGNTKSSYVYLVDEKGNVIYHQTKEKIGKPVESPEIKKVVDQIVKGQKVIGGFNETRKGGSIEIGSYDLVPKTSWVVVLAADQGEVRAPIKTMTMMIGIINLIILAIILTIGTFVSGRITKPIVKATELLDKTSNLDLQDDRSFDIYLKDKSEIGSIFASIGKMREHLRTVVQNLVIASDTINSNVALVETLTEDLKIQTDETSTETVGLSAGMEETAATAEQIAASTGELENAVETISIKAFEGSERTGDIAERANVLKEGAIASKNTADMIYKNVKIELEAAIEGAKAVQQIDKLAKSILDITGQTDLLALNAAIEAARAGDAGRGFAVVAEEVRKLAEKSASTAGTIQSVVKNVTSSVQHLTESSVKMLDFIDKNVTVDYDKFIKTGEQYNEDTKVFNDLMMDFSATSEELNASIGDIVKAINEVTETVNDGAQGVSKISNKTIIVVEKVQNIKDSAEDNMSSAEKLKEIISRFKV